MENRTAKYYSVISYTFKGGNGAIEIYHNNTYKSKTDYNRIVKFIENESLSLRNIIVTNILTFLNK